MLAKLFTVTVSDVISIALAAIVLAMIFGELTIGGIVGILIGNRLFKMMS